MVEPSPISLLRPRPWYHIYLSSLESHLFLKHYRHGSKTFVPPFKEFFFFFLHIKTITFLLVVETALAADEQFEACLPSSCGKGPNISYPFWINGNQSSFCGFPGFELSCKDREPILTMEGDEYIIRKIFYGNESFLMTKAGVSNDICSFLTYSLSLSLSVFTVVPATDNLFLFFNCTALQSREYLRYELDCTTTANPRHRLLAMLSNDPMLTYVNQSGQCDNSAVIPVDTIRNGSLGTTVYRNFIDEFLNKGFHLRWTASKCEECSESGGRCGFDYGMHKFMCFCPDRPHQRRCRSVSPSSSPFPLSRSKKTTKVLIGVGTGIGGVLLTCIIFILYKRHKRNKLASSSALISRDISRDLSSKPDLEKGSTYFQTPIFTYKELDEATNHFDSSKELGDGGFGTVYHGKLRDGRVVAVKRLFEHNYKRVDQFLNEIQILSRLRHQNLVSLYGCTNRHSRELLLVYEYVPNGTVADHLHGDRAKDGLLTWPVRMTIAIESADALAYLHASDIIHRDVKTNNILLDTAFHVKVADFGLSRLFPTDVTHVSTAPQGTPGYVDPEYYQCYQLNDRSDVYSFGVVLIELISSKPAVDIGRHRHEINLANMAINRIHNRALHELVDPSLGFNSDFAVRNMITLVAELAFRCLQQEKEMRPCMVEVLEILRGIGSEEYKKKTTEEMDISADARLLKNSLPLSPDSVTDKWVSKSTTPNTSG